MKTDRTKEPRSSLSQFALGLQGLLFSVVESAAPGADERHLELALVLEFLQVETAVPGPMGGRGRPSCSRRALFRCFVAKAFFNVTDTRELRRRLLSDEPFRTICGFPKRRDVPSEPTMSRAFAAFANQGLADQVHQRLAQSFMGDSLAMEVYRDSTDIRARESPLEKPRKFKGPKKKPGPRPGGERAEPAEPTRMERQTQQSLSEMLAEIPRACDVGAKKNSQGHNLFWIGYKLHVDITEGGLPLSAITSSASVHDSQVAIPLMHLSSQRARALYQIMDAGYIGESIALMARKLDQVAIVQPRATPTRPAIPLEPDRKRRLGNRWQVEQFFSWLKERFGARHLRVKGNVKAHFHLMCGVLAAFAYVALRL